MLFEPYIVIYQNVQGHSAVAWPPLCTKSKCFISSQNFFTLWPGKLHMISDRDIFKSRDTVYERRQIFGLVTAPSIPLLDS